MAYTYSKVELISLSTEGYPLNTNFTYNLLTETGRFAFGELLCLRFEINSSSAHSNGDKFIINPCFFSAQPFATQYQFGRGWLVEIISLAGAPAAAQFDVSLVLGTPNAETTERNYQLFVSKINTFKIQIDLVFYASQDLFQYLNGLGQNNAERLLSSGIGQGVLQSSQANVYTHILSYLELLCYRCDANYLPNYALGADPFVRSTLNPAQKQGSFAVAARFIDNHEGAAQAYSGANLLYNNLSAAVVNAAGVGKIAEYLRRSAPVLNDLNDTNFAVTTVNGSASDKLMLNVQNTVELAIKIPYSTPTKIVLMLMRTDAPALVNAQPFPIEYDLERAIITNNATAYPNYINGSKFSTPSTIVTAAGLTVITVQLDGNLLVQGAEYRIWAGLYNVAGRYVSSHLTPPLRAALQRPPSLTISGVNQSYNNSFTGNDTVMTTLARHLAGLVLDSSTYTGLSFTGELRGVKFAAYYDGSLYETGRYNFQAQSGAGSPQIDLTISGASYLFSYQSRLPYNGSISNKTLQIDWSVLFEYRDVFGSLQTVEYAYTQYIRVRPLNTTRITNITLLDYTDWLAAIETPIRSLCDNNPFVVVKVEKSGAPDANLIALAVIGAAQNSTNPPTIYEEESYAPLQLLPQESAVLLSQVDSTFGDNYAYFVLDTRYLPASNLFNAIVAITYNI